MMIGEGHGSVAHPLDPPLVRITVGVRDKFRSEISNFAFLARIKISWSFILRLHQMFICQHS